MNAPRFVRGTKSRLFLYLGALSFVGLVVYVYRGARLQLDDVRQGIDKCKQQQESLSAQLQVIFEYKLRLEKSLQQEKNEHRQTKDELQSKAQEEKASKDKELLEAMNKYTSLQQQHKILKSQHVDLDEECNKVRIQQLQSVEEKSKLESQVQAIRLELGQIQAAREKELEDLKSNYMQLEVELEKISKLYKDCSSKTQQSSDKINYLQKQNNQLERELAQTKEQYKSCRIDNEVKTRPRAEAGKSSLENPRPLGAASVAKSPTEASKPKTSPSNIAQPLKPDSGNFLPAPDIKPDAVDKANSKSTTPQINPEALISEERLPSNNVNNVVPMPPPENEVVQNQHNWNGVRQESRVHARAFDREVPAGVVPAPHGYDRNHNQNLQEGNNEIVGNEIGNPNFHNNWGAWNHRKPNHPRPLARNYQIQQDPRIHYENNRNAIHQLADNHNNVHHAESNQDALHYAEGHHQVADNPLNQHDNLLRFQYLNNRNADNLANDLQHRDRLLVDPQRNPLIREEPAKQIPRNAAGYPYNGEYENNAQKNDLQLEEAEEDGDDDVDQIDYGNESAKQSNHLKRQEHHEKRDGVMVNPK